MNTSPTNKKKYFSYFFGGFGVLFLQWIVEGGVKEGSSSADPPGSWYFLLPLEKSLGYGT